MEFNIETKDQEETTEMVMVMVMELGNHVKKYKRK